MPWWGWVLAGVGYLLAIWFWVAFFHKATWQGEENECKYLPE